MDLDSDFFPGEAIRYAITGTLANSTYFELVEEVRKDLRPMDFSLNLNRASLPFQKVEVFCASAHVEEVLSKKSSPVVSSS